MPGGNIPTVEQTTTQALRFKLGQASGSQLQEVIDDVLRELRTQIEQSPDTDTDLRELSALQVEVHEDREGIEPILTTIVLTVAGSAGKRLADRLWEQVLWPRIKQRLGGQAVGEREA